MESIPGWVLAMQESDHSVFRFSYLTLAFYFQKGPINSLLQEIVGSAIFTYFLELVFLGE